MNWRHSPPPNRPPAVREASAGRLPIGGQVRDAIVSFAESTAEKIRRSDQVCGNLQVSIATDSFDTAAPQYTTAASAAFLTPTADSRVIVAAALRIFERLWREGFAYRKAGVILLDLSPAGDAVGSLFDEGPLENGRLMQAVDRIKRAVRARLDQPRSRGQNCGVADAPGAPVPALHHPMAGPGGGEHWTGPRRTPKPLNPAFRHYEENRSGTETTAGRNPSLRCIYPPRERAAVRHGDAQLVMLLQVARRVLRISR